MNVTKYLSISGQHVASILNHNHCIQFAPLTELQIATHDH